MSNPDHGQGGGHDKQVTIVINGQQHPVPKDKLTYEEVVMLAFNTQPTEVDQFNIQYTRGHSDKPNGTLVPGKSVMVVDGMEFDVTPTNRS